MPMHIKIHTGVETEVKNFALNKNSVLKFSVLKGEIGWIFLYNTKAQLTAETFNEKKDFNLDKLDLIIFEADDDTNGDTKEEVLISTDRALNLF